MLLHSVVRQLQMMCRLSQHVFSAEQMFKSKLFSKQEMFTLLFFQVCFVLIVSCVFFFSRLCGWSTEALAKVFAIKVVPIKNVCEK